MPHYQQYERYRNYQPTRPNAHPLPKPYRTKQILLIVAVVASLGFGTAAYLLRSQTVLASHNGSGSATEAALVSARQSPQVTNLKSTWKTILANRTGSVDVAVYDKNAGRTAEYSNTGGTFNTASIVKLSILEKLLVDDQNQGYSLSPTHLSQATTMIENSDNTSATDLWNTVGAANGMNKFFKLIAATSTTAGTNGYWGLTQTTALDQLKVLNTLAYPGRILTAASAQQADALLGNIESDQDWGVSAGLPSDVNVDLKNGWLSDASGWYINSIGHIAGEGQDYTIAILSADSPSETYGIATVESLASATWQQLAQ